MQSSDTKNGGKTKKTQIVDDTTPSDKVKDPPPKDIEKPMDFINYILDPENKMIKTAYMKFSATKDGGFFKGTVFDYEKAYEKFHTWEEDAGARLFNEYTDKPKGNNHKKDFEDAVDWYDLRMPAALEQISRRTYPLQFLKDSHKISDHSPKRSQSETKNKTAEDYYKLKCDNYKIKAS